MKRGALWWADLGETVGSGPGYRHPVLVVSTDPFNESHISTVIVCVLTSNLELARAPGNVHVSAHETDPPKDAVVNVSQVLTVAKSVLSDRVGYLAPDRLKDVEAGLRTVMGL